MIRDHNGDSVSTAFGFRLSLEPHETTWADFRHRDAVVAKLQARLWADGLTWDVEEFGGEHEQSVRSVTWICPESPHCWVCLETRGGQLESLQVSFPPADNVWSLRLASVVVRAVIMYQLAVET